MKIFIISLFLLITSCSNFNSHAVSVEIENNLRNSGTYYVINSTTLPKQYFLKIEEILDRSLIAYDFTKLKEKTSKETANYLVNIYYTEKDSLKTLQISILDNTNNNLKNVFLGNIIFKESNPLADDRVLACSIDKLFINFTNEEDIKIKNINQNC